MPGGGRVALLGRGRSCTWLLQGSPHTATTTCHLHHHHYHHHRLHSSSAPLDALLRSAIPMHHFVITRAFALVPLPFISSSPSSSFRSSLCCVSSPLPRSVLHFHSPFTSSTQLPSSSSLPPFVAPTSYPFPLFAFLR